LLDILITSFQRGSGKIAVIYAAMKQEYDVYHKNKPLQDVAPITV